MLTGKISNIQRFSTGDGPGIRTTVFFKGCNLHCTWCHNPETQPIKPVMMYYDARCLTCGICASVCKFNAHKIVAPSDNNDNKVKVPSGAAPSVSYINGIGTHEFDRTRCVLCGECVKQCPSGALQIDGKDMDIMTVFNTIKEDVDFYNASNGGVTLSGGEPLLQPEFCKELAKLCFDTGISVIVDTAGCVPYESFEAVLPYTTEFFFDLKAPNEEGYSKAVGGSFALVIDNMKKLVEAGADVKARIPVIPEFNDDTDSMKKMADALKNIGIKEVNLLPFHRLGAGKYTAMGINYSYSDVHSTNPDLLEPQKQIFEQAGFAVKIEK